LRTVVYHCFISLLFLQLINEDDGLDDKIDNRTLSRAKKIKYDHERAREHIMDDWLSVNCIFNGVLENSPLPYPAYKFICEQLLKSNEPNAIFGHCFLTLEWSLMARADDSEQPKVCK